MEKKKVDIWSSLGNLKTIAWFAGMCFVAGITVYGFFLNNKKEMRETVYEAIKPLHTTDSLMLEWMRNKEVHDTEKSKQDALRWRAQEMRDSTIIRYVNNPELTRKIDEQNAIIKMLTDEIKKKRLCDSLEYGRERRILNYTPVIKVRKVKKSAIQ